MTNLLQKIAVLIPCYNEEGGIGSVIDSFPTDALRANGYGLEIIVIDNNSNDRTAEVAKAHGANVISEPNKGKGNAVRKGFSEISDDTNFVVMIDGDDTYSPREILRLIEPLRSGFCSVVLGSRLYGKINIGSMKRTNLFGNYVFSFLVRFLYGARVTDVLTGYYAWNRAAVKKMYPHLVSEGFTIEIEMITKMVKLGEEIFSVPITYDARAGESNLKPIADGIRIFSVLLRNLFWKPNTRTHAHLNVGESVSAV
jgi:glycosyltransferase involved in cell wall biosynthesis